MAKVTVDGIEVEVPSGASVLQACEAAGKEIPRFCYHERLSVAGNCRMCLVEVEKAPKPVASCSYPVADGMKVFTDTPMVRNGRRGVMEFLLINHPLDCPICDQGGECDLQDQAVAYGMDKGRYTEGKRAVKDKYVGPLIKTIMNRCIHCTRCVRFAQEVAGVPELGATGRGESMEIGTYIEKALTTELSGNLIDICPVGALTSRPYAFVARPWELARTDSVDVLDALGAPITISTRGTEILRIEPREHDDINEEWLGDRSRFSGDGLRRKRLDRPWIRRDGKLVPATWREAVGHVAATLRGQRVGALAGPTAEVEGLFALRKLLEGMGSANLDCRGDGARLDASRRDFYLFNSTIAGIDQADRIVVIGSNPRVEAPVLNARIRKRWNQGGPRVGVIGPKVDLTYPSEVIGRSPQDIAGAAEFLQGAERPMVILGRGALARADGAAVLAAAWELTRAAGGLRPDWHGFNVLHQFGGQVGALDAGFRAGLDLEAMLAGGVDALWLMAADDFDVARIPAGMFVVYQGHHGDAAAARADVILPGAAYVEKDGTYVNTEGRVQRGYLAIQPPGEAKEDWRIIRATAAGLGVPLGFDSLEELRAALLAEAPLFGRIGSAPPAGCADAAGPAAGGPLSPEAFALPITNYWQAEPISRASATMAECARTYGATQKLLAAE
ncbi:MAG: NADH-quinone oxidoreductase subunit NuoG [Acetobacteraceae bacterium]|nr:NADH-quinone oxidoreductase subunit NuoG [Acetobacteraceae bacterium]